MQEAIEAQLIGWMERIGEHTGRIAALAEDMAEVKEWVSKLNGSVARHEKALTEAVAWQRAHKADHVGTREETRANLDRRVEAVKAVAQFSPIMVALVALFVSCQPRPVTPEIMEPTAIVSRIETPTPTAYPTFTATIPADFPPPDFPTIPFVSPTPEIRGDRPIIELPPAPTDFPCDFREAYFTPDHRMKVHDGVGIGARIVGYIEAGQRWSVCHEWKVETDWWVCRDEECHEAAAYRIGTMLYGILEIIRP